MISVLVVLFSHYAWCIKANDSFEIEGKIEQTYHLQNTDKISYLTNWFRLMVDGPKCKIRSGNLGDDAVRFFEHFCDGTNSYMLIQYDESKTNIAHYISKGQNLVRTNSSGSRSNVNNATLIINVGLVPEYAYGLISPVWLAYGSGEFYLNNTSNRCEPVVSMGRGFRERGLTVDSQWKLSDRAPHILSSMCDFYDGKTYREEGGRFIEDSLPEPLDKPTTNVIYQVTSWTNFNTLSFPLSWEVVRYRPNVSRRKMELASKVKGVSQIIRSGLTTSQLELLLPNRTRITDKRLSQLGFSIGQYTYSVVDGQVKDPNELSELKDFKRSIAAAKAGAPRKPQRFGLMAIMVLLMAFPVVLWFWRHYHGNNPAHSD